MNADHDLYIIEFRDGSFFQNMEADHGGLPATACRFDSEEEADAFMRQHEWILFHGGMAMTLHKALARQA